VHLNSTGILISNETRMSKLNTTLQYFDVDNDKKVSAGDYFLLKNPRISGDYRVVLSTPIMPYTSEHIIT